MVYIWNHAQRRQSSLKTIGTSINNVKNLWVARLLTGCHRVGRAGVVACLGRKLVCSTGHRVNPWPGARAEKRRLAGEVERGGYSAHAVCPYCGPRHIVPVGIPVNVIEGVAIIPAVRRVIPELVDWRTTPRCRSSLVNRTAVQ